MLGFTQPHPDLPNDFKVLIQIIPVGSKSDKPINITLIDKVQLKCD